MKDNEGFQKLEVSNIDWDEKADAAVLAGVCCC